MMPYKINAVFSILVAAVWFYGHFIQKQDDWLFIGTPLIVAVVVFGCLFVWLYFWRGESRKTVSISPLWMVFLAGIFSIFLFNIVSFFRPDPQSGMPVLEIESWIVSNGYFLGQEILIVSVILFSVGAFFLLGNLITHIFSGAFSISENNLFYFLVKVALGMFGWIGIAFMFAFFGRLQPVLLWGIAAIVLILERKQVASSLWWFFARTKKEVNFCGLSFWISVIAMFFISLLLIDGLRPIPTGYDDMTYYMNRSNLVSQRGELVSGGNPYPFELLVATIQTISHSLSLGMSLGILCVILGFSVLYGFGKYYWDHKVGLVAGMVWLSLPMTSSLAIREVKPDTLLFFLSGLSIWAFFLWSKERQAHLLFLAVFFLGFAFSVKLTAIFLVASLFAGFVWFFWGGWSASVKERIKMIGIALVFFLIPLFPWIVYGFETRDISFPDSLSGLLSSVPVGQLISADDWKRLGISPEGECVSTIAEEDYGSYEGLGGKLVNTLLLPWDMTMNSRVGKFVSEIGFLFLALLPIFLFQKGRLFRRKRGLVSKGDILIGMAAVYWVVWLIFAHNVPWYGFPGFFFLCLFVALVIFEKYTSVWFQRFLLVVLFFGLITNAIIRLEYFGNQHVLRYAAGSIDTEKFVDSYFPGYRQAANVVATYPDSKVLFTASKAYYFIPDNDSHVLMDGFLDTFYCLDSGRNDTVTLDRLRELDFQFVFLSKDLLRSLQDSSEGTLKQKVLRFVSFAESNLRVVINGPDFVLLEVPR